MHGKRKPRCESEKNGRTHRRTLDDHCCTNRNLPKVFLYLLSMIIIYYKDFTLIYDVYYTSSSLSLSYSRNIVSQQFPLWSSANVIVHAGYVSSSVWQTPSVQILGASKLILLYQTLKIWVFFRNFINSLKLFSIVDNIIAWKHTPINYLRI